MGDMIFTLLAREDSVDDDGHPEWADCSPRYSKIARGCNGICKYVYIYILLLTFNPNMTYPTRPTSETPPSSHVIHCPILQDGIIKPTLMQGQTFQNPTHLVALMMPRGLPEMGVSIVIGLGWWIQRKHHEIIWKWMIWEYPYFRKPPYLCM